MGVVASDLLVRGIIAGLSFMVLFVLAVMLLGRGVPAILRLLALWIWIASKRVVRFLRLLARVIEQARRRKDRAVRRQFAQEQTRRLRGPKVLRRPSAIQLPASDVWRDCVIGGTQLPGGGFRSLTSGGTRG